MGKLTVIFLVILALVMLQLLIAGFYIFKSRTLLRSTYTGVFELGNKTMPQFRILIDGDSVGAGVGATSFSKSLTGRIGEYYSEKNHVTIVNNSKSGSKMKDLIEHQIPEGRFDLVILVISANDLFLFTDKKSFSQSVPVVLEKYSKVGNRVIIIGPAKVQDAKAIPFFLKPIYSYFGKQFGEVILDVSKGFPNVIHVNPQILRHDYTGFSDTNATDGFHPNDEGHRFWFEMLQPFLK